MVATIEVFADITCPFTHVGLKRVVTLLDESDRHVDVIVRAWPLEWVNGAPMEADAVRAKAAALHDQLGVDDFHGLRADRWPSTTLPALDLAAQGYAIDAATGLAVSLALRSALFEEGRDVADAEVLADIASAHGLEPASSDASDASETSVLPVTDNGRARTASAAVVADYEAGRARGVTGSPHFFVGTSDFFCPALDLGHDAEGHLTARLDTEGLDAFLARVDQADRR